MSEQSFGILAKNRRRELGLTQDELARRVGCAPITIRKIEADDLPQSIRLMISKYLPADASACRRFVTEAKK